MNESWLEAVIKGKDHVRNGAVEAITLDGLSLSIKSQNGNPFLKGERVSVDLYLREPNRRYTLMKAGARVAHSDEERVRLRFNPMTLPQHRKLEALIDFASATERGEKDRREVILFSELLEDDET
jgi:hypothetical protein